MTKKKSMRIIFAAMVILTVSSVSIFAQQYGAGVASSGDGARYNASGEKVIVSFLQHAAELRSVISLLSAYSGIDMVVSDAAKATVSISVTNKTWREILTIICMVHNLTFVEEPSFIYVMSNAEAAARGINLGGKGGTSGVPSMLSMGAGAESFAQLVREVIPMRYTTAQEMAASLTPFLTQRGKLTAIKHTNAIVIVDTDDNLTQLKHLIGQIDIQTPQVSISCKIIEVGSGTLQNMSVNLGFQNVNNNFTVGQFWSGPGGPKGASVPDWSNIPLFRGGSSVASPSHFATFGILDPKDFGVTIDYLFSDNKTEIVAQPQITTLNNKEAKIFMGAQISLTKLDESGNTVTELIDVGTELIVTPYVSGDGKILLALEPRKESYSTEGGNLVISKQSAKTNVLVNNGETVVIAGLTSNEKKDDETGIPFLKDIPIIGYLFKSSRKTVDKKDLVIFVTPHIIHPDLGLNNP